MKTPSADLKRQYPILIQCSIALSLLFMLALTRMDFKAEIDSGEPIIICCEPEIIIELPPPTLPETPPAPLKPFMPIEVPDNTTIDEEVEIPPLDMDTFEYLIPEMPQNPDQSEIFDSFGVEVLPEMIGGLKELYSNIKYPEIARKSGIQGLVSVQFIVNENGDVEDATLLRGIGGGCDEEVLRVIESMSFTPGVQNGRLVKVKMVQTVRFTLYN